MKIIGIILSIGILYFIYKIIKWNRSSANHSSSPLYNWNLRDDLDPNTLVPWDELLKSNIVSLHEVSKVFGNDLMSILPNYTMDDIVFIHYTTSRDSWEHLAGREGYVAVSKKERKQIEFLTTIVS